MRRSGAAEGPDGEERRRRAWPVLAVAAAGAVVVVMALDRRRRHIPADLGRRLVELFAELGDVLSEYQDVVAGEAYLGTGRRGLDVELVFGDGALGKRPAGGFEPVATYRTGTGASATVTTSCRR